MSKYKVCGYDMEVLHQRQLEIAIEIDRICREQGIKYSLYGGSVIGAVRHNGFIPGIMILTYACQEKTIKNFWNIVQSTLRRDSSSVTIFLSLNILITGVKCVMRELCL